MVTLTGRPRTRISSGSSSASSSSSIWDPPFSQRMTLSIFEVLIIGMIIAGIPSGDRMGNSVNKSRRGRFQAAVAARWRWRGNSRVKTAPRPGPLTCRAQFAAHLLVPPARRCAGRNRVRPSSS